jgi:hypothetical protein
MWGSNADTVADRIAFSDYNADTVADTFSYTDSIADSIADTDGLSDFQQSGAYRYSGRSACYHERSGRALSVNGCCVGRYGKCYKPDRYFERFVAHLPR